MLAIKEKTLQLIDALKATCQSYGMGNDGNEYKIITQVFLYKFLNDKFGYEIKNAKSEIAKKLNGDVKWEEEVIRPLNPISSNSEETPEPPPFFSSFIRTVAEIL